MMHSRGQKWLTDDFRLAATYGYLPLEGDLKTLQLPITMITIKLVWTDWNMIALCVCVS